MTPQDMSRRFSDMVKLRAYKDKYVDEKEETEILEQAIKDGISFDAARAALMRVCESEDYVLESIALERIKETVETFAGNDGKVDEKEFKDAVSIGMKATRGKKTEADVKRMVITIIESGKLKVKTGWLSNWYSRVKAEVGMA